MKNGITGAQKTAIWTIVRKHDIDTDTFRDWLRREYGTSSTRKLSREAATEVIQSLKVFVGEDYRPHETRTWGLTGRQMRKIKAITSELGWHDPKRIDGLVKKMFDPKNRVELLTKTEGTKLITALERMVGDVRDGVAEYA